MTIQDLLNFGKTTGTYTAPKPVVSQTPAQQLNQVTYNAYNPALAAAASSKPSTSTSSNSGSSSSSSSGSSNSSSSPAYSGRYTQANLPSELFNASGNVTYNGQTYSVANNGDGTRTITPMSSSTSSGPSAEDMQKTITDNYNKQQDAYAKGLATYDANNPFNFDDMLAKENAKALVNVSGPYTELLNNYLKGVENVKGYTAIDEQRALTKLQADYDAYTGQSRALLNTTMRQVGQSYGNAGSYDAGARARAQGEQEANTAYSLGQAQRDYNQSYGTTTLQADRTLTQDIPLAVTKQEQAYANQERIDAATQGQQLAGYDQAVNNYDRQKYAIAQVPDVTAYGATTEGGVIPGRSKAETDMQLQSMLPGVQINTYGGATPTPIMGYGGATA